MEKKTQHWSRRVALLLLCLIVALLPVLSGCQRNQQFESKPYTPSAGARNDICILFTGDVHGADDENIGYAGVASYKAEMEKRSDYVTLVDTGDAVQGGYGNMVGEGGYAAELMKRVGYDFAVLGNHEFDYGISRLRTLMENTGAQYLGCNISYTGEGSDALYALKPYEIVPYGEVKVAYIGVSTPFTMTDNAPITFMEDGEYVYDFLLREDGAEFYQRIQETVDTCRTKGADYVILLSHLGDSEEYAPFSSTDVIKATTGIDVVLDGHSHKTIPGRMVSDREGEDVLLASTGTELNHIGRLLITPSGNISVSLISEYSKRDEAVANYIQQEIAKNEHRLAEKIVSSSYDLSIYGPDGARLVCNRETAIGNLVADAYRASAKADIAFVNGGGVRASFSKGNITYGDVIKVQPYGNFLCKVEATGSEIADALELAYRVVEANASSDGEAIAEDGGFLQLSGLRVTIDTSIESTVDLDEKGSFVSVKGARRVTSIEVLQKDENGEERYVPLVADQVYTVASIDYILQEGGDGYSIFTDNTFIDIGNKMEHQVVAQYLKSFAHATVPPAYAAPEGRICIQ